MADSFPVDPEAEAFRAIALARNSWHHKQYLAASNTNMSQQWTAADIPSLSGKRVLITGANSGIGYRAALKLARKGAKVMLACRDPRRGQAALDRMQADSEGVETELVVLDLASLSSIREFAKQELARHRPLHLLINNAGVYAPPKRLETADGFELQFGTNVLGHFALTAMLMPALQLAADTSGSRPRVVTVASIAHKRGQLNFDDLQSTRSYSPMKAYAQSKLANLMLAFELERRLRDAHASIMSVAAHPGIANTNLFQQGNHSGLENALRSGVGHAIGLLLNNDAEGALPTLYAATAKDAKDGGYYGPQGFQEMRGDEVGPAHVAPQALDEDAADHLWQVCERLTGVRFRSRDYHSPWMAS
jgi:NAD(P)-dependent dehydrogenase (short-subunit alcohol dehydrogenase family)